MKTKLLAISAAIISCEMAFGVNMYIYSSNSLQPLPMPNADGSFSETSSAGEQVRHIYYIISEEEYNTYTNARLPSAAVYNAWLDNQLGEACLYDEIVSKGYSDFYLDEIVRYYDDVSGNDVCYDTYFDYNEVACFAAIFIYYDETSDKTYYIAEPLRVVTWTEEKSELTFEVQRLKDNIAIAAGRWQVVSAEPPEIVCQAIDVAGGIVSATYGINDIDSLDELVIDGETSVIVAADLARTTQTNLAASVTATNSGESTFTFSFNPAEQNWTNSTLFIFGVEPPR